MFWRVEVKEKPSIFDAIGYGIKKDIDDLKVKGVFEVSFVQVYYIEGDILESHIKKICDELLADPISQSYSYHIENNEIAQPDSQVMIVEIAYNPGVMDPAEQSTLKGIRDLGINSVRSVRTAKKYILNADITNDELLAITDKLLYNKLIQHVVVDSSAQRSHDDIRYDFRLSTIDLLGASDKELERLSKDGQLFLNLTEMKAIQAYFKKIKRNPTDCELETIAQTWSEHCGHKTFRGLIDYTENLDRAKPKRKKINNLLKSTVMKATEELKKPWCVSVFKDNSGVIKFDDKYNVCFKVETHNHPSALEPFGGANTGVGGVIRDPLGTGLGAKPILNTDVFCFAPPDYPHSKVPQGALHPKRIAKGVVSGVRDYGNKMGIPTVNGAILFHEGFIGNPLVYCGTAGIMPKNKSFKKLSTRDLIVVVGGRTGRDGIHGATFSSGELTHESQAISGAAVQIGNPIQEKKMVDTIIQARDKNLYDAITDCGAGGLSSAVGEMGAEIGAKVSLDKVPLKYQGLSYTEIWISESQERMVLSVPKNKIDALLKAFSDENVEATVIGEFTDTKRLELYYKGKLVSDLDMNFLHNGLPKIQKRGVFSIPKHKEPKLKKEKDLTKYLLKLLSHYDICSKEWVIRQYDHEVQGGSVIKPLVGVVNDGPSDASIVRPVLGSNKGIVVSNGINFRFGFIDPFWMAASCIDEALRQVIAVGGSLKQVAILDNFCWGNPDKPDRLGTLVRAAEGCYAAGKAFGTPFISGKDSLYNEYAVNGKSIAIPGTLLISALSVMDDVSKAVSMDFKNPGNLIYCIGRTYDELGGSHYFDIHNFIGNNVPKVNFKSAKILMDKLSSASNSGLIESCHDASDGGIAVSLAEMAFAGGFGAEVFTKEIPYSARLEEMREDFILFSESNSRFIAEVSPKNKTKFERAMKGVPIGLIGCVSKNEDFKVYGLDSESCIETDIKTLKQTWKEPLKW